MKSLFLRRLAITIALVLVPYSAMAGKLVMKNGDIITGLITLIESGDVTIEPSYADPFTVAFSEVLYIETDNEFDITLPDGSEVVGTFGGEDNGEQVIVVDEQPITFALQEMEGASEVEAFYDRTSHIDWSFVNNSGNTDSRSNLLRADTRIKHGNNRHYGELTFSREETDDISTKEQDLFLYQYGYEIADPWIIGGTGSYERDPIRDLQHRWTIGATIGRDLIDRPGVWLNFNTGIGYQDEELGGISESGATWLWFLFYEQDFMDGKIEFYHNDSINYQFYGDNNMIFKSLTGARFDLYADMYFNVSLVFDYETEPAEGAENEDTTLNIGIGVEF